MYGNKPLEIDYTGRTIKVVTECVFQKPMVEIEHKDFHYCYVKVFKY